MTTETVYHFIHCVENHTASSIITVQWLAIECIHKAYINVMIAA